MTTNKELLEELFTVTVKELLARIQKGTASASDLSVARNLLSDNDINAIPTKANGLNELANELPFNSTEGLEAEMGMVGGL